MPDCCKGGFLVYQVTFINERGQRVNKVFRELYHAKKFAMKIRYSKKCTLVYAPLFD